MYNPQAYPVAIYEGLFLPLTDHRQFDLIERRPVIRDAGSGVRFSKLRNTLVQSFHCDFVRDCANGTWQEQHHVPVTPNRLEAAPAGRCLDDTVGWTG